MGQRRVGPNQHVVAFDAAVMKKLTELGHSQDDDAATFYDNMTKAIHHAIEVVLPDKKWKKGVQRVVSEETQTLYEKRKI